jgi:hypothetical protein
MPASTAYAATGLCYGSGSISGLPSMTVNPGNASRYYRHRWRSLPTAAMRVTR